MLRLTPFELAVASTVAVLSAVFGFLFVGTLLDRVISQNFLLSYIALFFVVLGAALYHSVVGHRAAKRGQALIDELNRRRLSSQPQALERRRK